MRGEFCNMNILSIVLKFMGIVEHEKESSFVHSLSSSSTPAPLFPTQR